MIRHRATEREPEKTINPAFRSKQLRKVELPGRYGWELDTKPLIRFALVKAGTCCWWNIGRIHPHFHIRHFVRPCVSINDSVTVSILVSLCLLLVRSLVYRISFKGLLVPISIIPHSQANAVLSKVNTSPCRTKSYCHNHFLGVKVLVHPLSSEIQPRISRAGP